MNRVRTAALALVFGLLFSGAEVPVAYASTLNTIHEGDSVPAFTGRNLDGDEVDVGAILGKRVVVLAFWSIYCKPCVEEISSLIRLQEEFREDGLEVIGINVDSELGVGRIRKFMSRFEDFEGKKINYEIIFDEENRISQLLGVGFLPTVLSVNTRGQVERIFVGFEEKSEEEIFTGMKTLLPSVGEEAAIAVDDSKVFTVEAAVPLCGFYSTQGWIGSFTGNRDLDQEIEKAQAIAQSKATKLILKEALLTIGINLAEDQEEDGCFRSYGVYLMEDPLEVRDNLTNLIRQLPFNRLLRTMETRDDFLGTEYRHTERATVNMVLLRDILDTLGYVTAPQTVTFSIININKLDQERFEKILLQQSKYIGYFSFPTYTIFTTVENFSDEMEKLDLEGLKLFIEDTSEDRIELEVWR